MVIPIRLVSHSKYQKELLLVKCRHPEPGPGASEVPDNVWRLSCSREKEATKPCNVPTTMRYFQAPSSTTHWVNIGGGEICMLMSSHTAENCTECIGVRAWMLE